MLEIGEKVIVNDNILEYYDSLKEMHGRVGIIQKFRCAYAIVDFTGKTNRYQKEIPIDCLDVCSDDEFERIGTADLL